jgi:hypothetical protein
MNPAHPLAARRIERIRKLLEQKSMTTHETAAAIHLCLRWTISYLKHLHTSREIFVERWVPKCDEFQRLIPSYRLGNKPDAPRSVAAQQQELEAA